MHFDVQRRRTHVTPAKVVEKWLFRLMLNADATQMQGATSLSSRMIQGVVTRLKDFAAQHDRSHIMDWWDEYYYSAQHTVHMAKCQQLPCAPVSEWSRLMV